MNRYQAWITEPRKHVALYMDIYIYIYINVRNFAMVAKDWWIEFSKSFFLVRSLSVQEHIEKKWRKNASALTETEDHIDSFQVEIHSMSSLANTMGEIQF